MKILLVADEESESLWDYYSPEKVAGVDLILSAGDLKAEYLSFLVTMVNRPVLYVHGNHDVSYAKNPPEGCDCIDGDVVSYKGLRILGLGGSCKYNGTVHQYTEKQMKWRIFRLRRKIRKMGGVDIILTHAPARSLGDAEDLPHRGFECFVKLMDDLSPKYFIHGHIHLRYNYGRKAVTTYGNTTVINCSGYYILDIPDGEIRP